LGLKPYGAPGGEEKAAMGLMPGPPRRARSENAFSLMLETIIDLAMQGYPIKDSR
jgi:hypothetical protein